MIKRFEEIDYLRGSAILIMIITHVLAYYLKYPMLYSLWNLSHFVVPFFIFVSTYIIFKKEDQIKKMSYFNYFKKRILRLFIPYWIFLAVYLIILILVEKYKFNITYLTNNIFLIGGLDINWLVLLFIYVAIISRLFLFIKNNRILKSIFLLLTGASTVLLLFYHITISYRFTMWLPWSLVIIYSYYWVKNESNKFRFVSIAGFFLLFIISRTLLINSHQTIDLFQNKYPPNIYYLSFGLFMLNICWLIFKSPIMKFHPFKTFLNYLSRYSYSLFFIHYLVIYLITKLYYFQKYNVLLFFVVVLMSSILIQCIMNYLYRMIVTHKVQVQ